jgi:hypothetical protein
LSAQAAKGTVLATVLASDAAVRRKRSLYSLIAAALGVSLPSLAFGQVVLPPSPASTPPWNSLEVFDPVWFAQVRSRNPDETVRPEDLPVKTRQQPGYEPIGVRSGAWLFSPALSAGGFFNSNVFATPTDPQGDFASELGASLAAQSLWERHSLSVSGTAKTTNYRKFSGLDETDATLSARGRFDIHHDSALLGSVRIAHLNEGVGSVTSPTGAVEPTPYDVATGDLSYWHQFGRFAGSVGVRSENYKFGSTVAQDGSIINQDSRDGNILVGHTRLDYALSGMLGLFTGLEVNRRDLRGTPTQSLSSNGYRSLSGVDIQITSLVSAELAAGFASQRFDDPTIGTIEGPSYRARINWSPRRTLDLHFNAEQIVTQAAVTVSGGIRADALQFGFDYEFRPNIVLSASGTYERDTYFGQPRIDNVVAVESELKYLVNRYGTVSLRYRFLNRDSSNALSTYDKHEVGLNVTAHY